MPSLDMTIMVPAGRLRDGAPSDNFINLNHSASSLGYSLTFGDVAQAQRLHDYTLREAGPDEPYVLRRDNVAITAVTTRSGLHLYTRSDARDGCRPRDPTRASCARFRPASPRAARIRSPFRPRVRSARASSALLPSLPPTPTSGRPRAGSRTTCARR